MEKLLQPYLLTKMSVNFLISSSKVGSPIWTMITWPTPLNSLLKLDATMHDL
jgi:hypothetical protein